MDLLTNLKTVDPEIQKAIDQELSRQREKLEMIASENIVSTAVMQAQGSILTNKYAEGYPGKRYYGGCEYVDIVEQLAIDRAKKLFGAEYANVQPHSGAQANTAVYFALLEPGDTILGMNLTDGGHLTHGMDLLKNLDVVDTEIQEAINKELSRQRDKLEMIASENIVSKAVMQAQGSVLTNKYAEGYPGKRYYGGCEYVDVVEQLAIDRAKKLFGAEYANVQPHSGAQANTAVYFALLQPGDTILGMNLTDGGHLTHGSPVNISGKYFKIIPYGVDKETERIDYDELERLAKEHQPKLIVGGASAYSRVIDFERMAQIAKSVGAYLMIDMAHIAGLVAAGLHPSPVPYADVVTTTTHKTLRGPRGGLILCRDAEFGKQFNKAIFPGIQGGPLMHVVAAKAVAFKEALSDEFKVYQQQVLDNAKALADELVKKGFRIVSGGTDNHLMLVDLRSKNITGKEAQFLLDEIGITANRNTIPFEPLSPFVTSGIRLGTPALTTRGLKEEDIREVADIIADVIENREDGAVIETAKAKVQAICKKFPLYEE